MAFAIVQWEGFVPPEVSIVPSSWLCLDDGVLMSYWPSSADGDKSIKKRSEPKKTWGKYAVQQIGKAGKFAHYMHIIWHKVATLIWLDRTIPRHFILLVSETEVSFKSSSFQSIYNFFYDADLEDYLAVSATMMMIVMVMTVA